MATIPSFDEQTLQAICDVLGDTASGLTGGEIGRLLRDCRIEDPSPLMTKRHRIFAALSTCQERDRCGNNVAAFIMASMNPVRHVREQEQFIARKDKLNEVLAFASLSIGDDGRFRKVQVARTISEAKERAGRLLAEMHRRNVHADVLKFCKAELLQDNYFHAVFEAAKSIADKIREMTGLTSDGTDLVDVAFGGIGKGQLPRLAFNSLRTETERSEHTGLMNLIKGLFGAFRNTTAHSPRIKWPIDERDAVDMLTLASLIHRRLDRAVRTERP